MLDTEALRLQSANRDGEGNDEVCEDPNRVRVTDSSKSSPDLCLVSQVKYQAAGRREPRVLEVECLPHLALWEPSLQLIQEHVKPSTG